MGYKANGRIIDKVSNKINSFAKKIYKNLPWVLVVDYMQAVSMAQIVNPALKKYRNCFSNKDVYIVGGGETVKLFDPKKRSNDVYIGINRAFRDERYEFDFLFAQDQFSEGFEEFIGYRGDKCTKLLAIVPKNTYYKMNTIGLEGRFEQYVLASRTMKDIPYDISIEPFADLCGTGFSAIQFAIYGNAKSINLIGFDCTVGDIFCSENKLHNFAYQLPSWYLIKNHAKQLGVLERFCTINPVGLKGLFKDIYSGFPIDKVG